jgi:hypothetical protein
LKYINQSWGKKIIIPTFLVLNISRPYNTCVGPVYLKSDTNTTLERTMIHWGHPSKWKNALLKDRNI